MRGGGPIDPRPSPLRANSPLIVDVDHPSTSKSSGSTHLNTTEGDFFSLTEGRPNALARRARGAEEPHRPGAAFADQLEHNEGRPAGGSRPRERVKHVCNADIC